VSVTTFVGIFVSALLVTSVVVSGKPAAVAAPNPAHVMLVLMENEGASNIVGNSALPYVKSLASNYGYASQSYALRHPSLPNYLALVSGSNQGVTDDNPPSSHRFTSVSTLADQLAAAGVSEKAYAENLPSQPTADSGLYAVRHNPWEYFPNARIAVVNSSRITSDLNSSSPPDFVWYTPNITDDGHTGVPTDTSAHELADTESFLSSFVPSVQATNWYKTGGKIIIEWDEALDSDSSGINGGSGGHVATIVVSSALKARPVRDAAPVDTVGILRSIEDQYGLTHLANAANSANGTIDSLLSGTSNLSTQSITNGPSATAWVGKSFSFAIKTTGSPTPTLKKKGRLPKGLHFRKNHNGTATMWGTPSAKHTIGRHYLTIVATYGKGKTKQVRTQTFTLTVNP